LDATAEEKVALAAAGPGQKIHDFQKPMILLAQPHPFRGMMFTVTALKPDGTRNTIPGSPVFGADGFFRGGL
jgi:hypothetical protein